MKLIFTSLIFLFFGNYAFGQKIQYSGKQVYRIPNNTYPHKTIKKSEEHQMDVKSPMNATGKKTSKDLIKEGKISYNMPIVDFGGYESFMPIAKPDSAIVYTILNKP
ncbi:hypothetical protein EGI22_16430 [Lacihabitans sp. LS3-19]|uniref:hypothetical protein n=1 Tax=Lacihabitans sp. LS3-19 TaxID=2487335 RepID=UPI0020CE67AA|nr:hypothetical protein [Lacihabitans sp. LS3-19]MCP9769492.1 hypothetical protein [Lacihabitans sp. LS3-19]